MTSTPLRQGWRWACSLSLWALAAYATIVLPVDALFPFIDHWYVAGALLVGSLVAIDRALGALWLRGPVAGERAKNLTLLAATSLLSLLGIEVVFAVYGNLHPEFRIDQARVYETRVADPRAWVNEVMPSVYFLGERRLWLYKPNQFTRAPVYGEHYYSALLEHPLMRDSVLELRDLDFQIDAYGLRNRDEPAGARLFALGDSFCFGFGAPQSAIFPERMKAALGEPVYNLGMSATSPVQQVELLEHLFTTHPEAFRPEHLLWLIFEGNDLQESVRNASPLPSGALSLGEIFADTILEDIATIPAKLRKRSVIRLLSSGHIALKGFGSRNTAANHHALDGTTLAYPLFHSPKFGYRLMRESYLDFIMQPESFVLAHPNRPRFDAAFQKMQGLAAAHDFRVTVVIVPTGERLYRSAFEDMPAISEEPHFIRYVEKLAEGLGFDVLDLNARLAPIAERELLYYRDDTHWNERGHQVVADLLTAHVVSLRESAPAGPSAR